MIRSSTPIPTSGGDSAWGRISSSIARTEKLKTSRSVSMGRGFLRGERKKKKKKKIPTLLDRLLNSPMSNTQFYQLSPRPVQFYQLSPKLVRQKYRKPFFVGAGRFEKPPEDSPGPGEYDGPVGMPRVLLAPRLLGTKNVSFGTQQRWMPGSDLFQPTPRIGR